jgi:hypothetical protein
MVADIRESSAAIREGSRRTFTDVLEVAGAVWAF